MADDNSGTIVQTRDIKKTRTFALAPDAGARAALAGELGISAIRKLSFRGQIALSGKSDLLLQAELGATVVQPCVVTFEPVTTRIDEPVMRLYLAEMPNAAPGDEVEMPEDDTAEPLPREIDLAAVMAEALTLALPLWPRAEGVDPVRIAVAEPGQDPMTDDDAKPFAALRSLRDKLGDGILEHADHP